MAMLSFLSVSPGIIVDILSEWISDADVCGLDSAICCHKLRQDFSSVLNGCTLVCKNGNFSNGERYKWLNTRKLVLKTVYLQSVDRERPPSLVSVLPKTSSIRLVEAPFCHNLMYFVAENEVPIESLKLFSTNDDHMHGHDARLESILSVTFGLTHLDISECKGLTNKIYEHIADWCPTLQSIRVPYGANVRALLESCHILKVENCLVTSILECQDTPRNWICSFEKVDECDCSAIDVGGNYFHLTGLVMEKCITKQELDLFFPLVQQIRSLRIDSLTPFRIATLSWVDEWEFIDFLLQTRDLQVLEVCTDLLGFESALLALVNMNPSIHTFSVTNDRLPDQILVAILRMCPKLTSLYVMPQALSNELMDLLGVNVNSLEITATHKDTVELSATGRFKKLKLSGTLLESGKIGISVFANLCSLQRLEMHEVVLNVEDFEILVSSSPVLSGVSIVYCQVEARSLLPLARCSQLTALSLFGVKDMSNSVLEEILTGKTYFAKLVLNMCRGFTPDILSILATYCLHLQHLGIHSKDIRDIHLLNLLEACPRINCLDLSYCSAITCDIFSSIKSRRMRYLNVSHCSITEQEIQKLLYSGFTCSCEFIYK